MLVMSWGEDGHDVGSPGWHPDFGGVGGKLGLGCRNRASGIGGVEEVAVVLDVVLSRAL